MYNFDNIPNRRNTYSLKWDVKDNELPMWVADMDFECAPKIIDAIKNRLSIKALGYSNTPIEYYQAFIKFFKERHHVEYNIDEMFFSTGVVPSISSIVRSLTNVGDRIVILTPVYNIFFNSIRNNKRIIVECPLDYHNNEYNIDYDKLENELANPLTKMIIFCNPHNPVGRIWTKEELEKIGALCNKHNVIVVSDEIHCDIVRPNKEYVPFYSVNDICKNISVNLVSATKCFNMAGIQASLVVIHNKELYKLANRGLNTDECAEGNFFSYAATIAALNSIDWLDEMNEYVSKNFDYLYSFINENIKELTPIKSDATYLAWIDCSKVCDDSVELANYIREKTGLYVSDGYEYGDAGKKFIRINLATNKANVIDCLNRLKLAIDSR